MKILWIPWGDESQDLLWGLVETQADVEVYPGGVSVQQYKVEEKKALQEYMQGQSYLFVISYYFIPVVSDVCQCLQVKYASWVVDSPQIELYTKVANNPVNYVFVFDKKQYHRMKKQGIQNVFHLPLATNVSRVSGIAMTEADEKKYACDISFVGNLYEDNHYNRESQGWHSEIKAQMDQIIKSCMMKWNGHSSVFGTIGQSLCESLQQYVTPWKQYDIDLGYFYELYYIARKVTEIERTCLLNGLALSQQVELYTGSQTTALEGVHVHGKVSYTEEAPKIFNLSKINLNISMRTIETGVPQRVFDIMGAGGFVLSNYQEELEELFVAGEEIVFFHDIEELLMQVNFYLSNERERVRIAMNGYRKVKDNYTYDKVIRKITDIINRQ